MICRPSDYFIVFFFSTITINISCNHKRKLIWIAYEHWGINRYLTQILTWFYLFGVALDITIIAVSIACITWTDKINISIWIYHLQLCIYNKIFVYFGHTSCHSLYPCAIPSLGPNLAECFNLFDVINHPWIPNLPLSFTQMTDMASQFVVFMCIILAYLRRSTFSWNSVVD